MVFINMEISPILHIIRYVSYCSHNCFMLRSKAFATHRARTYDTSCFVCQITPVIPFSIMASGFDDDVVVVIKPFLYHVRIRAYATIVPFKFFHKPSLCQS